MRLHLCEGISHGQEGPGCRELCLVVFPEQRRLEQAVHRTGIMIPQPPVANQRRQRIREERKSQTLLCKYIRLRCKTYELLRTIDVHQTGPNRSDPAPAGLGYSRLGERGVFREAKIVVWTVTKRRKHAPTAVQSVLCSTWQALTRKPKEGKAKLALAGRGCANKQRCSCSHHVQLSSRREYTNKYSS